MKIVKHQPEFKPVSITLESQDEVNWVYELFGNIGGGGRVRKFVDDIYYGLEDIAQDSNVFDKSVVIQIK